MTGQERIRKEKRRIALSVAWFLAASLLFASTGLPIWFQAVMGALNLLNMFLSIECLELTKAIIRLDAAIEQAQTANEARIREIFK